MAIEEDPFLLLGYGMNSYFEVMVSLMKMVVLIMFVTVPLMMTYGQFDALASFPGYEYNKYTLGNVGGADAVCTQATFTHDATALSIDCPAGTTVSLNAVAQNTGAPIFDVGIISVDAPVNTYCANSAFSAEEGNVCSHHIKKDLLFGDLKTKCVGQSNC